LSRIDSALSNLPRGLTKRKSSTRDLCVRLVASHIDRNSFADASRLLRIIGANAVMPLCETLIKLVDIAIDESPNATPADREWASALQTIVAYRDRKRLNEWEAEINRVSPAQRTTPLQEMLGEIEMLGMSNLYQAFDVQRTIAFYDRLCPYFLDRGIELSISLDLDGW